MAEGGRFAQAAEVLRAVIAPAAEALGAENLRVLSLRRRRAAVLIVGGDFRSALPEFDALVSAYRRTAGRTPRPVSPGLRGEDVPRPRPGLRPRPLVRALEAPRAARVLRTSARSGLR
ncbi:hypothetical protein GCM10010405_42430 [Streptomyces macrosporus]|uniref:Uncharacterized protein n=1 Tax=Streptomyces macrosporus TaxID=44032 RepID=A0ABN3KB02_9ACTN